MHLELLIINEVLHVRRKEESPGLLDFPPSCFSHHTQTHYLKCRQLTPSAAQLVSAWQNLLPRHVNHRQKQVKGTDVVGPRCP